MTWYLVRNYNHDQPFEASGTDEKALSSVFIHGYGTQAEAIAHPQRVDTIAQQAVVNSVLTLEGTPGPGGTRKPAGAGVVLPDVGKAIGNAIGLNQIGAVLSGFFTALSDVNFWRSLGWIALGIIMLISGLALWAKQEGVIPNAVPVPV